MGKRSAANTTAVHSKIVDSVSSEDESEYSDVEENNLVVVPNNNNNEVVIDGASEDEITLEDLEEEEEEEEELQPIKKRVKKSTTTSSASSKNNKKRKTNSSQQHLSQSQLAAIERTKKIQKSYMQKNQASKRITDGSKTALAEKAQTYFDFNEIGKEDLRDDSRQVITKKAHYPQQIIGVISKAQRINFSKKPDEDEGPIAKRGEIVVDVNFVYDSAPGDEAEGLGPFKRSVGGVIIDYKSTSIRVHLPKRFQRMLLQLDDMSLLIGGIIATPVYDLAKWIDKKDENKSTIPFIILLKSRSSLESFGLTPETFPSIDEITEECNKLMADQTYEEKMDDGVKIVIEYMIAEMRKFKTQEFHNSNDL